MGRIIEHVDIHQGGVVAEFARHRERAHAVLAHVGERHWRPRYGVVGIWAV